MKTMNKKFDVIIVGGGPSGLSVGSELSKQLNVLIIDKNIVGETKRSWFVPFDIIEKNQDIKHTTYGGVRRFLAKTFSGASTCWKARLFDRYPYIKEKEILEYWRKTVVDNGSTIINDCSYIDHTVENDTVTVKTAQGEFEGNLLIDASGYNSPIRDKYDMTDDNYYWWSVYGCIAKHPNGIGDMKVGDYMLWQTFKDTNADLQTSLYDGRPVFEYEILDENTSLCIILYLRKKKMDLDHMKKEFMHIIRDEDSTENFHDIKMEELKYGWYPSGGLTFRLAQDQVAFIGDAGCWTTPCGWGMAFILNNYKQYSQSLIELVKKNKLDKKSLYNLVKLQEYDKFEIIFDQIMTHFLSNASADQLDRFINFFNIINPIICEKMFTLKINKREIKQVLKVFLKHFELDELAKILPKEDYKLVAELAKFSIITSIQDFIYKIFHGFKNPIRNYGDGYDFEDDRQAEKAKNPL